MSPARRHHSDPQAAGTQARASCRAPQGNGHVVRNRAAILSTSPPKRAFNFLHRASHCATTSHTPHARTTTATAIGLQPLEILPPPNPSPRTTEEGEAGGNKPNSRTTTQPLEPPPSTNMGGQPKPTTKPQKVALLLSHIGAVISVVLVARWANGTGEGFLGGLDWADKVHRQHSLILIADGSTHPPIPPNKDLVFNYHPILMVAAFVLCFTEALLTYRTFPFEKKTNKAIHLGFQSLAVILMSIGLRVRPHSSTHPPTPSDSSYKSHSLALPNPPTNPSTSPKGRLQKPPRDEQSRLLVPALLVGSSCHNPLPRKLRNGKFLPPTHP